MTEGLSIDDIDLNPPARTAPWFITDLAPLWELGPKRGGKGTVIPGANGAIPNLMYFDENEVTLPLTIMGNFDVDGDPTTDARVGLQANVGYLQDNLEDIPDTADQTRDAVLTMPDGSIRVGNVQVRRIRLKGRGPHAIDADLVLYVPAGRLQVGGS